MKWIDKCNEKLAKLDDVTWESTGGKIIMGIIIIFFTLMVAAMFMCMDNMNGNEKPTTTDPVIQIEVEMEVLD